MKLKSPIAASALPRLPGGRGRNTKPEYDALESRILSLAADMSLPVEIIDAAQRTRVRTAMGYRGR